jgi:hypothetical protein
MKISAAIKREQKKLEKQVGKLQHPLNGCKSIGPFDKQGTQSRKEAHPVRCCTGQDWQSHEETVGEI